MNSGSERYMTSDTSFVFENLALLPIQEQQTYLKEGFVGLCTGGSAVLELFDHSTRVSRNDMVVILPLQFASLHDRSDDFAMRFFKVDRELFMDIMSGVCRMTPDFYFYMRKHFCSHFTEKEVRSFNTWCDSLDVRIGSKQPEYRRETAVHLLRAFFWELYVAYCEAPQGQKSYIFTHKEQIVFKFSLLIAEYYTTAREVAFYADKLCITPKYLTLIATQVTGRSARQCIGDFVVMEMKALLRNANIDIKELVKELGFRNQSALSRYFRRQTGMSPSEYRERVHLEQHSASSGE